MTRSWTPALLGLAVACTQVAIPEELQELMSVQDDGLTRVEAATVQASRARLTMELPGEIKGAEDAMLASAEGGLVERVRVKEGQDVRRGQVLVELDRKVLEAQLSQARAQLEQARAEAQRMERLGDLATGQQLLELGTRVASAEANVQMLEVRVERATVRAPFSGVVGALAVEEGEYAQPGAPVVRLVQLDPVRVSLPVSDRDVVALSKGMPASVRTGAAPRVATGTVDRVSPVADLSTRSFLVEVLVDNADRQLLPGMIARVSIERDLGEDRFVIPQDWLVTRGSEYGLFIVMDRTARWSPVSIAEIVGDQVVLEEGLEPGSLVVMTGQHDLVDGDKVKIARQGLCCEHGRVAFTQVTAAHR